MSRHRLFKAVLIPVVGAAIILAIALPAQAAPPLNDDIYNATWIAGLPFSETLDTREATRAPDDPYANCWGTGEATVWYTFTPPYDMQIEAHTAGSTYDTLLAVYSGWPGSLYEVACNTYQNLVTFDAYAGQTYYFMVADLNTGGPYPPPYPPYPPSGGFGGTMVLTVDEVQPPPNDKFVDATAISALPFTDFQDTTLASIEPGEPTPSCSYGGLSGSIWYAFTPSQGGSITASLPNYWFSTVMAVYTGNSLNNLAEVGCSNWGSPLTFSPAMGTTYYFQVGGMYGDSGQVQFHLELTPPPVAGIYFYPYDPSIYDNVQFYDNSYDPVGVGIERQEWDFGDGTFATGCCPTHRFGDDGDYTVQLMVWTYDGRQASTEQPVHVETHDVAVTRFKVPNAASAGQTRQIVVGVNNKQYDEFVYVELYRSGPGGYFEFIGTLTQYVPVRSSNRTTDFKFTYTFTPEDAAIGKVNFRAVAYIQGYRDAIQTDNESISAPTKVN